MEDFKPLELKDKIIFDTCFIEDPPQISEMTFTNLFIWQHRYHPVWTKWNNCLLIILVPDDLPPFGLQPVGPGNKRKALDVLCGELKRISPQIKIQRVGENYVKNILDHDRYLAIPDPDNSDYVYNTLELINLSGKKYHRKKNHLNRFKKSYSFEYRGLDMELVECFLDMQEHWCRLRECLDNQDLLVEDYAIYKALTHFEELGYRGGAIQIDSRIEAFAIGEPLNRDTAVIHIEKANPDIPDLYSAINQLFCSSEWSHIKFINREQDLGIEGLRKAKQSYYPAFMVNKYTITPK